MLIALITVPFVGRFRLVLLPDRASLPPTTFDTTAEPVEPAQGPGLAKASLRLVGSTRAA
jgi:hypothetical protein